MPESLNAIITGSQSSANTPNPVLAVLPASTKELGYLQLFGELSGHLDTVGFSELKQGSPAFVRATNATGGSDSAGSQTNPPGTVTRGASWGVAGSVNLEVVESAPGAGV